MRTNKNFSSMYVIVCFNPEQNVKKEM